MVDPLPLIRELIAETGFRTGHLRAIWGRDRCFVELRNMGAFEVIVQPYAQALPPDVVVERAQTNG